MTGGRDESEALKRLEQTVLTSRNATNKPAYEKFQELSEAEKRLLLSTVVIVPKAPDIDGVGDAIRAEARLAVRREHLDGFVSRLEGWWFRRAIRHLVDSASAPILSVEIESEWNDLQDQFKRDALPVDRDILEHDVDSAEYSNAVFVHQAQLAGIGDSRILFAIRDYYRAFAQRSTWMREDLLLVGELEDYERLLREEWALQFSRFADEIGTNAAEDAMRSAAQKVYAWVENSCYPIRPQVQHPSMSRGSFQILADNLKVGWHPEFMHRLHHLLEPKEAT